MINGILVIDKPEDWTSHDVVAKLRGVLKEKRVGHGGTLDPLATGVLPIFIGRATRAAEYCENAEKEYIAGLRLGITTDTQDITGSILSQSEDIPDIGKTKKVLQQFKGSLEQIPPMYSAIKKDGKKLYELARQGIEVERKPRKIEIFDIEMIEESPEILLRIICSKGTYIRTLCHDVGQTLGCGAVMSSLRRTRAGVFTIDAAHKLDDVVTAFMSDMILTVDSMFSQYPAITLSDTDTRKVKNGALRDMKECEDGKYRFYAPDGEFLLFGEIKSGNIRSSKSFYEV